MNQKLIEKILRDVHSGYNAIADDFSRTRETNWKPVEELVQAYVKQGNRVLDAGCGSGRLVEALARLELPLSYTGYDNNQALLDRAAKQYGTHYNQVSIEWQAGDLASLPAYDNMYDIIFCVSALHHIPTKKLRKKIIENFHSFLKPSGHCVMINWDLWTIAAFNKYGLLKQTICNRFKGYESGDFLIPWKNSDQRVETMRYCHSFTLKEFVELFDSKKWDFQDYKKICMTQGKNNKLARSFLTIAQKRK